MIKMVIAFIFATTKTGKEAEVLEKVKHLREIKEAYNVYGDYDVFIKVEANDLDQLNEFLVTKIRNIPEISMTTTMIGL